MEIKGIPRWENVKVAGCYCMVGIALYFFLQYLENLRGK